MKECLYVTILFDYKNSWFMNEATVNDYSSIYDSYFEQALEKIDPWYYQTEYY